MTRIAPSRSPCPLRVLVAVLFLCPPAWQRSEAAETGSDRELCRGLWEGYLEGAKARQPERMAFATDAVGIYPDTIELRGRDAIRAHLVKVWSDLKVLDVGFKIDRCEVAGARAYSFVTIDERIQEGAAAPARRHARCAAVWERRPDKSWQIAHLLVSYRKLSP